MPDDVLASLLYNPMISHASQAADDLSALSDPSWKQRINLEQNKLFIFSCPNRDTSESHSFALYKSNYPYLLSIPTMRPRTQYGRIAANGVVISVATTEKPDETSLTSMSHFPASTSRNCRAGEKNPESEGERERERERERPYLHRHLPANEISIFLAGYVQATRLPRDRYHWRRRCDRCRLINKINQSRARSRCARHSLSLSLSLSFFLSLGVRRPRQVRARASGTDWLTGWLTWHPTSADCQITGDREYLRDAGTRRIRDGERPGGAAGGERTRDTRGVATPRSGIAQNPASPPPERRRAIPTPFPAPATLPRRSGVTSFESRTPAAIVVPHFRFRLPRSRGSLLRERSSCFCCQVTRGGGRRPCSYVAPARSPLAMRTRRTSSLAFSLQPSAPRSQATSTVCDSVSLPGLQSHPRTPLVDRIMIHSDDSTIPQDSP